MAVFKNRIEAGNQLAPRLVHLRADSPVVLAIPRGGVPVAVPVARQLEASLTVIPLRRLAISWRPENDYGYVTSTGELHLNQALVGQVRLTPPEVYRIAQKERVQLMKDLELWEAPPVPDLQKKTVVIVDDGMHSGWAMFSAVESVRKMGAGRIIAAVPVSHFRAKRFVAHHCDEVLALTVEDIALFRIENYFDQYPPVSDEEIKDMLSASRHNTHQPAA